MKWNKGVGMTLLLFIAPEVRDESLESDEHTLWIRTSFNH